MSKRFQRLYLERLNYLGITLQQVLGPNVTKSFCKNAWTRKTAKQVCPSFFFSFFRIQDYLVTQLGSLIQLFWTPPLSFLTRLMFTVEGNIHTHNYRQKKAWLKSIFTLIKKVPILITGKQLKNLHHPLKQTGYSQNKFENLLLNDLMALKRKNPFPYKSFFKFLFINYRAIITPVP